MSGLNLTAKDVTTSRHRVLERRKGIVCKVILQFEI